MPLKVFMWASYVFIPNMPFLGLKNVIFHKIVCLLSPTLRHARGPCGCAAPRSCTPTLIFVALTYETRVVCVIPSRRCVEALGTRCFNWINSIYQPLGNGAKGLVSVRSICAVVATPYRWIFNGLAFLKSKFLLLLNGLFFLLISSISINDLVNCFCRSCFLCCAWIACSQ